MRKLYTTDEVAGYLRMRRETVLQMVKAGRLPAMRTGRTYRFAREVVEQWLLGNTVRNQQRILVVDPDPGIRRLFEDTLKDDGFTLRTASHGREAVKLVQEEKFSLIFLALMIPGGDGSRIFETIREFDERVKVIIITAYPESELMGNIVRQVNKMIQQGPIIVMKKPFGASQILDTVRQFGYVVPAPC